MPIMRPQLITLNKKRNTISSIANEKLEKSGSTKPLFNRGCGGSEFLFLCASFQRMALKAITISITSRVQGMLDAIMQEESQDRSVIEYDQSQGLWAISNRFDRVLVFICLF